PEMAGNGACHLKLGRGRQRSSAAQGAEVKAVGSGALRRQGNACPDAGAALVAGEMPVPQLRMVLRGETRRAAQKRFYLFAVLLPEHRTGDIGEQAARLHIGGGDVEDFGLFGDALVELLAREPPFG